MSDRECAICALGGGCLATVRECIDCYCSATRRQVEERLKNGKYPAFKELMEDYISKMPIEPPPKDYGCCCVDKRKDVLQYENSR